MKGMTKASKENWTYIIMTLACLRKLNDDQKRAFWNNEFSIEVPNWGQIK